MVLVGYLSLGKCLAVIGVCNVFVACSKEPPLPPFVANPTEPWEGQLAQERREHRLAEQSKKPRRVEGQGYGYDQKTDEDKHSVIVTTLADIVAFPLRGAAWLAHTLL